VDCGELEPQVVGWAQQWDRRVKVSLEDDAGSLRMTWPISTIYAQFSNRKVQDEGSETVSSKDPVPPGSMPHVKWTLGFDLLYFDFMK
jgi:hypothetical protein